MILYNYKNGDICGHKVIASNIKDNQEIVLITSDNQRVCFKLGEAISTKGDYFTSIELCKKATCLAELAAIGECGMSLFEITTLPLEMVEQARSLIEHVCTFNEELAKALKK